MSAKNSPKNDDKSPATPAPAPAPAAPTSPEAPDTTAPLVLLPADNLKPADDNPPRPAEAAASAEEAMAVHGEKIAAADAELKAATRSQAEKAKALGHALFDARAGCKAHGLKWGVWVKKHAKYTQQHANRLIRVHLDWKDKVEKRLDGRLKDASLRAVLAILSAKEPKAKTAKGGQAKPRATVTQGEFETACKRSGVGRAKLEAALKFLKIAIKVEAVKKGKKAA